MRELLPGTILKDRYQIIKTEFWRTRGGVYEVWDKSVTEKRWIAREIIPRKDSPGNLLEKKERILKMISRYRELEDTKLPKILDYFEENYRQFLVIEHIDGINLEQFKEVISRVSEKNAVKIGMSICKTLLNMESRGYPYFLFDLSLSHIMLNQEKEVRLTEPGFYKIFMVDDIEELFDNPSEKTESLISELSGLVAKLLGIKPTHPLKPQFEEARVSPQLAQLLMNTMEPGQKQFSELYLFYTALDKIINPEKYKKIEEEIEKRKKERFKLRNIYLGEIIKANLSSLFNFVKTQSNWAIFLESLGIILIFYSLLFTNFFQ
ncbi:MAG: hypothetical protein ACLFQV_04035, partial [Vulcanimicrobiota bacterium]